MLGGVKVSTYNDFCPIVNNNVTVEYSVNKVSVLGKASSKGSAYIDNCTLFNECNLSTVNCPLFKKLNNL